MYIIQKLRYLKRQINLLFFQLIYWKQADEIIRTNHYQFI